MHLLAITPGEGFHPARWEPVLCSGVNALLIREPSLSSSEIEGAARWCLKQAPQVQVWVRGMDVEGCGRHVPEHEELPPFGEISRPLHHEAQWEARRHHAQLLISPVGDTPGKGPAWGLTRLHAFLDRLPSEGPRLLALGGMTPAMAQAVNHPRLAGIAAIRPFWMGAPRDAVLAFREAWG